MEYDDLVKIQSEIDYYANANAFDKETDMYNQLLLEKYKKINLFLFYFFYIVFLVLSGIWVYKNINTLTTIRPILGLVGVMAVILFYPFYIHMGVSYLRQFIHFLWQNVRNVFS